VTSGGIYELDACRNCPAHSDSVAGSSSIEQCTCFPGFTSLGLECTACPRGKYKSAQGPQTCTDCSSGTYSGGDARTSIDSCLSCPQFAESPQGSASRAQCICRAGYSGSANLGFACAACEAGKYKEDDGNNACTSCPLNSESQKVGSSDPSTCLCSAGYSTSSGACAECPQGTYKSTVGMGSCRNCQSNSGSEKGSTLPSDCLCIPGYDSVDGQCIEIVTTTPAPTTRTTSLPPTPAPPALPPPSLPPTPAPPALPPPSPPVATPPPPPPLSDEPIVLSFGLPISVDDFDASAQRKFINGIAAAGGVDPSNVQILSVKPARRRAGIDVTVAVIGAKLDKLSADNINKELSARGLPKATVTVVSESSTSLQIPSGPVATTPPPVQMLKVEVRTTVIAVACTLGAIVICMVLGTWFYIRKRYPSTKKWSFSSTVRDFHADDSPSSIQEPSVLPALPLPPSDETSASKRASLRGKFSPVSEAMLAGAPASSCASPRSDPEISSTSTYLQYEPFP
jgi:hypothetical protein